MSELFTSNPKSSPDHLPPLRVAVVIPNEGRFFAPNTEHDLLFKDSGETGERLTSEKRAVNIASRLPDFGLPAMSAYRDLGTIDGIHGYAVRPAGSVQIDRLLNNESISEFNIHQVIADAEQDLYLLNPIDLNFLKQAFRHRTETRPLGTTVANR